MSSISKLSISDFPPCYLNEHLDLSRCSNKINSLATTPNGLSRTAIYEVGTTKTKYANQLYDRIPKPTSTSAKVFGFPDCLEDCGGDIGETCNLTKNTYPHDENGGESVFDKRYIISALSFCGDVGNLELGKKYHALIAKIGIGRDEFLTTSLIDMYAKCGQMENAVILLDRTASLDVASCNCLISGFMRIGMFTQAFHLFMKIERMGIKPNHYTYSIMLTLCRSHSAIQEGKQLHAHIVKKQYLSETAVCNALLSMYTEFEMMGEAEVSFNCIEKRNIISWTSIMDGFYQHKDFKKALKLFHQMRMNGIEPNEYTFTVAIGCCGSMKDLEYGLSFQALVIKKGISTGSFVGTAIVGMYQELGKMKDAEKQLKEMGRQATNVTWNALIAGYVHNEKIEEAMEAFCRMVKEDSECNEFTYSIVLKASSSLPSLAACEQVHSRVIKARFEVNTHVGSSLIEAYAKCGSLGDAERVFCLILAPDVVSWNSMIKAYSQYGYPSKAITLFRKMVEGGIKPTGNTFLAVISACSHSGSLQEGGNFFQSMLRDYGIPPKESHYSSMVDLLGRAAKLEDALEFIHNLPIKPTASIWRPLLAACRCCNNLQMAEYVANHILAIDPKDATVYITLSNMYAEKGKWADAEKQRKLMESNEIKKEPGCSWIEVNNRIFKFFSHDKTHIEMPKVYERLRQLMKQIKDIGYTANTNLMLLQISGQAKKDKILYHSEKLAVVFGLIKLPAGKPIRVLKNVRVCDDCHLTMKYISRISGREIILRDNYRFHYFKQGCCTCGDFW